MKRVKFLLSIFLVAAMLLSLLPAAALADASEQDFYSYESADGEYVLYKVSHADSPTNQLGVADRYADGIVDYVGNGVVASVDQGQGDRSECYSWAAAEYGDWIYVATCADAMMSTMKVMGSSLGHDYSTEQFNAIMKVIFNGELFISEEDGGTPGGIIAKINAKTGETKLLMSKASCGMNMAMRNACKYDGKIYFCGSVNSLPVILQIDPETDEYKVVYQGMTMADFYQGYTQGICSGIRGLCEFDGELIVSCVIRDQDTGVIAPLILSSDHPWDGQDAFTKIASFEDLYEYPGFHFEDSIYGGSIGEIAEFNGSIYVSICTGTPDNMPDEHTMQSFAIVRGDKAEDGSWTWTPVVGDKADGAKYTFGIDPERTRAGAGVLQVFGDYLYIGEYNDEEIALEDFMFGMDCTFLNLNFQQSVRLYRMDKNENIELVVGDSSEMFPDGSLSGIGSGFGHNENQYIWRMNVCDGKLYVGTMDTSSILEPLGQFANFDLLKMSKGEWQRLLGYIREFLEASIPEEGSDDSLANMRALFNKLDDKSLAEMFSGATVGSGTLSAFSGNVEKYALSCDSLKDTVAKLKNFSQTVKDVIYKASQLLQTAKYLGQATRGFDMYVTEDGVNFSTITIDGFGDPFNHGLRVFANTDAGMVIGTANPYWGTQIWRLEDLGTEEESGKDCSFPFIDVDIDSFCRDAVKWALDNLITCGVDLTHFDPTGPCTRAQAVTFMWRAAGCPAPESSDMPFADVSKCAYYYKAVQWAFENGITAGTTATTFSPNTTCTRAQIVCFLFRAAM